MNHPAADLFPMMSEVELQALADDIRDNGQQVPIIVDAEGLVVDGRNRLRACEMAGVEPAIVTMDGQDPLALVVSLNVKRRNLSQGQRAIAAAQAWDHLSRRNTGKVGRAGVLAEMFDVSSAYVERARKLMKDAPEAAERVKGGGASLEGAWEAVMEREREAKRLQEQQQILDKERTELDERLAELSQETVDLDLLPAPAEDELVPTAGDLVKAVSLATQGVSTAPSAALRTWEKSLKAAAKASDDLRHLPAYPEDGTDMLGVAARAAARRLIDAAARIVEALPAEDKPNLRSVK